MKKLFTFFTFILFLGSLSSFCFSYQPDPSTYLLDNLPFPRLGSYYQANGMAKDQVSNLAKKSLVISAIGVYENESGNPGFCDSCYQELKRLNPNFTLLAYIACQEVHRDCKSTPGGQLHKDLCEKAQQCQWTYKRGDCYFGWMDCINNPSKICRIEGKDYTWDSYLAAAINRLIFSQEYWDGIYFDNAGTGSWDGKTPLSPPGYSLFTQEYASRVGKLIAVNSTYDNHNPHASVVNIALSEDFPEAPIQFGKGDWRYSWKYNIRAYFHWMEEAKKPRTFFGFSRGDWYQGRDCAPPFTGCTPDPRGINNGRYGLGTILLHNGFFQYVSSGRDIMGPWLDEYAVNLTTGESSDKMEHLGYLGFPRNDTYDALTGEKLKDIIENNFDDLENRVYRRDFDRGVVFVNPSNRTRIVGNLGNGIFKRIKGKLTPSVNNGEVVVDSITLGPTDALILLINNSRGFSPPNFNPSLTLSPTVTRPSLAPTSSPSTLNFSSGWHKIITSFRGQISLVFSFLTSKVNNFWQPTFIFNNISLSGERNYYILPKISPTQSPLPEERTICQTVGGVCCSGNYGVCVNRKIDPWQDKTSGGCNPSGEYPGKWCCEKCND